MAKANPKRVVFAEANHVNMLKAAAEAKAEGICFPILLGNEERLAKIAAEENISLDGIEIVNLRHDRETRTPPPLRPYPYRQEGARGRDLLGGLRENGRP